MRLAPWALAAACTDPDPPVQPPAEGGPSAPTATELTVTSGPVPNLATAWAFDLATLPITPVDIACALDDDPLEVHAAASAGDAVWHHVELFGLLADADYTCVVTAGEARAEAAFRTEPLPAFVPPWTITVAGDPRDAYVLFDHHLDVYEDRPFPKVYVVDREGRVRWYHVVLDGESAVDAQYLGGGEFLIGGESVPPQRVDLARTVLARAEPSPLGKFGHQATRIDTGEVLALVATTNGVRGFDWQGFAVESRDEALGAPTWTWESQSAVDDGTLPVPTEDDLDPYHANAFSADADWLYVNVRSQNQVVAIDRDTGELEWHLGPGGVFTLLDAEGAPLPDAAWAWGAHGTKVALPRVLAYDNGRDRPDGTEYSRIVELDVDASGRTARIAWEHREDGWFEPIWGDADWLDDGRVLFTRAHCDHCIGPAEQRTEIVELEPATDTVTWRLTMDAAIDAGYRAEQIDGCALFANAKYCARGADGGR